MPVPLRMFPNTQFGYNGRSLRVSAVASLPFVISDVGKEGIPYKGLCIEVLDIITKLLNVTATYVEPQDGTWGWIDNGMLGQLKRRELDLIASDIVFHAERALHVGYITPYMYSDERVFAYKMSPATQPIFLLAGPLKPTVYLVHVAVGFLVIIIILLMETFGRLNSTRPRTGACNLLWELFKPSFKQGLSLYILNTPGRLLLIFWWLLVMLISALYCGNLTATLAANTNLRKFRSIDELVESDFSMGFMKGGIMPQLLKNSPRGDIKRLYQKFLRLNESDPRLTSNNKAFLVQRVMDGHYAFAVHKSMVEQLLEGDCTLSMLHFGDRTKTPLSFVVQKNSPFKDDIEEVMQQLDSSGLLRQMWKKWNNQTKSRTCNRSRSNVRVTTAEVVGAVIVTSTGIGLASLSLLLERLAARWKQT